MIGLIPKRLRQIPRRLRLAARYGWDNLGQVGTTWHNYCQIWPILAIVVPKPLD